MDKSAGIALGRLVLALDQTVATLVSSPRGLDAPVSTVAMVDADDVHYGLGHAARSADLFLLVGLGLLGLPALPAMDASDAEYDAWAGKVATMLGLPKPPSANASEAQWDAWFTTLMGMSGMPQMPGGMPHKPGTSHASSKPAGPVVQTDRVAPSSNAWGVGRPASASSPNPSPSPCRRS